MKNSFPKLAVVTALLSVLAGCGGGSSSVTGGETIPTANPDTPAASTVPAITNSLVVSPADSLPVTTPSATTPSTSTPSVATPPAVTPALTASAADMLAAFGACPERRSVVDNSNSTWPMTCLVGKRLSGKAVVISGLTSTATPAGTACELFFKADGAFEYSFNGILFAATRPYTNWGNPQGLYVNTLNDVRGTYIPGSPTGAQFFAVITGDALTPGITSINNQNIAIVVQGIENRFRPAETKYTASFRIGRNASDVQLCSLNVQ